MKYLAIKELHEKENYSISWMCSKLGINRAAYYKWLKRPVPDKEMEDIEIVEKIRKLHKRYGGILGYRRMTIFLNRKHGTNYNSKRIHRIMRIIGIHSSIRRVRNSCTVSNKKDQKADNLLKRNFEASAPNEKWTTDVTEFRISEEKGKLYLSHSWICMIAQSLPGQSVNAMIIILYSTHSGELSQRIRMRHRCSTVTEDSNIPVPYSGKCLLIKA